MKTYTYHHGEQLPLVTSDRGFVSRATRQALTHGNFEIVDRLSQHSFRVAAAPADLENAIEKAKELGPSFYDYYIPDVDETLEGASEYRITDRIFVRFRNAPTPRELAEFHKKHGTQEVARYSAIDFLIRVAPRADPTAVVRAIQEDVEERRRIVLAEHDANHRVVPQQITLPTGNELYANSWHLHKVVNPRFVDAATINCEDAWRELDGFGSENVVIGVTDGAFDVDHPDFDGNKIAGWAYIDENNRLIRSTDLGADRTRLMSASEKLIDHGTACAGLVAASVNGQFAVGVAPACRLYFMKFPTEADSTIVTDSYLIDAIRNLRGKVDVVTSSWGRVDPRSVWCTTTQEAISEAALHGGRRPGKGIVFVWAAGNSDRPLAREFFSRDHPIPYQRIDNSVRFRTARLFSHDLVGLTNVLHVGASTSRAQRAHYSNYGPGIDLVAPSNNEHFFQCNPGSAAGNPIATSRFIRAAPAANSLFGGTSASAPIVAGVAALTISANPELTASQTISILKQTAERRLDLTPYPRATSHCRIDPPEADVSPVSPFDAGTFVDKGDPEGTRSPWFGFGRVDALGAVRRAREIAESETLVLVTESEEG